MQRMWEYGGTLETSFFLTKKIRTKSWRCRQIQTKRNSDCDT